MIFRIVLPLFWFSLPACSIAQTASDSVRTDLIVKAAREVAVSARYCTLVTLADGHPQARVVDPFPPESDLTVWIATNARSRKVAQLRTEPRATLLCYDQPTGAYVSFLGNAEIVTDSAEKARRWKPDWKEFYADENRGADYLLIRFKPRRLEILSAAHGLNNDPVTWRPVTLDLN